MRVLNICVDDHANFMFNCHVALLMSRVDSYALKLNGHPFNYQAQAHIVGVEELRNAQADIVIIYHSDWELAQYISCKNIIYVHTGTKFRQRNQDIIPRVNHAPLNLIALPEFHNIGLKNEQYFVGPVSHQEADKPTGGNIFGHFPSNPSVKGTNQICEWFDAEGVKYFATAERVNYDKQLDRIRAVDIYVELFNPMLGQHRYGSFGMSALEAAQLGKVVITQNVTGEALYKDTYGECELEIGNTEAQFRALIRKYKDGSTKEKAERTIRWFNKHHSLRATGDRLKAALSRI